MHDNKVSRDGAGSLDAPKRTGRGDPLGNNSEIGRKLREYYEDLVSDSVPDRFSQLLSQLEGAEKSHGEG